VRPFFARHSSGTLSPPACSCPVIGFSRSVSQSRWSCQLCTTIVPRLARGRFVQFAGQVVRRRHLKKREYALKKITLCRAPLFKDARLSFGAEEVVAQTVKARNTCAAAATRTANASLRSNSCPYGAKDFARSSKQLNRYEFEPLTDHEATKFWPL